LKIKIEANAVVKIADIAICAMNKIKSDFSLEAFIIELYLQEVLV
jgi:hypothetical protein